MSNSRQSIIRSFSVRYSAGSVISWHAHDWHQLVYASEGAITVEVKSATWLVPIRRAVWIPARQVHQVRMHGPVFLQSIYLQRAPSTFARSECQVVNMSSLLHELLEHVCHLGIVRGDSPENRCLIQFLRYQLAKMSSVGLAILLPREPRARALALRIIEEPGSELSLQTLSRECSSSLRTMQRAFQSELGISLGRWRHQVRMVEAVRRLSSGLSVTETALALGFESLSAFIQSFRQYFGATPGKYLQRPT
jgi:AraC-like DNA-binding protein